MVNRVILVGNLGRDPEVRRLENGAVVAKFSLATNEKYKDKNGQLVTATEWHEIVVWRNLAERAEALLKKGMSIYLEGKLTHRTWQDQEGNNRKTTEVVAGDFRILSKKGSDGSTSAGDSMSSAADDHQSASSMNDVEESNEAAADDLPF
jgi:single-strand DNA-binding protein